MYEKHSCKPISKKLKNELGSLSRTKYVHLVRLHVFGVASMRLSFLLAKIKRGWQFVCDLLLRGPKWIWPYCQIRFVLLRLQLYYMKLTEKECFFLIALLFNRMKSSCSPLIGAQIGASVERPFDSIVIQNCQAIHSIRSSMNSTVKDHMVSGLFFCATLTGRRRGHTPFV